MRQIKVPPIKIQGIKTKLVPWILSQIDGKEYSRWIEPFMGSGVVGFNLLPKQAIFCDLNPHLINFYNAVKTGEINPDRVRKFLTDESAKLSSQGEIYYYKIRERFNTDGHPLHFLFLNRSCFNGMIRFNKKLFYNVPFGHKPERFSKSYITKIVNQIEFVEKSIKLNEWVFKTRDFRVTLEQANSRDFIYCDPPYIGRHVDYYDSWNISDEIDLHNLLIKSGAKFIVSTWHSNKYRVNETLRKVWSDCNFITREHFYHIGAREKNRNSITEALIMNFPGKTSDYIPENKEIFEYELF
jgi:DNA adenine methylase